jgi:hypothetical protein
MAELNPQKYRDKATECRLMAQTLASNGNWIIMAEDWEGMARLAERMLAKDALILKIERERDADRT